MRNLQEYPITPSEVIEFTKEMATIEAIVAEAAGGVGDVAPILAKTVLAVVRASALIVKNDVGSSAAELLTQAFNSQNIPVREIALVD